MSNIQRVATAANWPQENWAIYLPSLLTGEDQAACQAVNLDGKATYAQVKTSTLQHLGISLERYDQYCHPFGLWKLVPAHKIQNIKIACIHGDAYTYPSAMIDIKVGSKTAQLSGSVTLTPLPCNLEEGFSRLFWHNLSRRGVCYNTTAG